MAYNWEVSKVEKRKLKPVKFLPSENNILNTLNIDIFVFVQYVFVNN